ncbi:hypothetical protein FJT64_021896 [Amphibalanus amphitrite]|uniref:Membrane protein FAM174 n=1 Tax=Amphibalanus amphitrite TaxID=1232801 RepID=A0A6A4WN28_AMPAM|nr:uncharacterized protein LOC122368832 isoform X1 [Amphibalanus amphitrite]XP_043199032.1 uncharacterized protein LOC122368832 isoform X1 [Amphibalanus amphitrite]XP_043199033.1 uncharacterized protein LOC122368832 isoform X1 [Amphibalanus amphitrite]XP_043199036.1 uncharacterized protein LOC122368832 isoform X1 [Amphibalanus amphitrite]XP_043199395.1 uncharacterized protein LOC122369074 isoform X1 [Amphibalanus amphitrite]XP_043199396.1 uncharacterized protein LOC122369074 isoform X1 [Amphib
MIMMDVTMSPNISTTMESATSAVTDAAPGGAAGAASVSSVLPEAPLLNATQADGMMKHISPGALMRGSIVFGVLCALVVVYIAFRTCRLRRNRKTARYNVLSTNDETAPLHSDEDEETVFDAASSRR